MPGDHRVFIDTNILVYQFDNTDNVKQTRARDIVSRGLADSCAVISTQIVQEFMNVALRKFATPLTAKELVLVMEGVLEPLCQHSPDFLYYKKAMKLYETYSLRFYDALVVQAALDTNCQILYSEDMQDGQAFGKLVVKNPFKS